MKDLLLAGGTGSRLHPLTRAVSKQLMPVYNKPMVYYPLATLILAGIREVLVITTPDDVPRFRALLGDGTNLGMRLEYAAQPRPEGLAQAFRLGRDFLAGAPAALVLGDNLFHGEGLAGMLQEVARAPRGATIFGCAVSDPRRYGVVTFDDDGPVVALDEKPDAPRSHWAIPGLYFYDADVVDVAAELRPSPRGELEITDVNRRYLAEGRLTVKLLSRGTAWFDTGRHESLLDAADFIHAIEARTGLMVGAIEEVAWRMGYVDDAGLERLALPFAGNSCGRYLLDLLAGPGPRSRRLMGGPCLSERPRLG